MSLGYWDLVFNVLDYSTSNRFFTERPTDKSAGSNPHNRLVVDRLDKDT